MRLLGKHVQKLEAPDILRLLDDQVQESLRLDYKQGAPWEKEGKDSSPHRDFLADISAMANTVGGVLVYGVRERRDAEGKKTGVPEAIDGIGEINLDDRLQWIENVLGTGLTPRLPGSPSVEVRLVKGKGKNVLAVGVRESFARPHMIWRDQSGKVFRRRESGNYQANVEELRRMFLEGTEWSQGTESFRRDRILLLRQGKLPPKVDSRALGSDWVHILPLGRLATILDLRPHAEVLWKTAIHSRELVGEQPLPMGLSYNFDGILTVAQVPQGSDLVAHQWLRCGGVEMITNLFQDHRPRDGQPCFYLEAFTKSLVNFVGDAARVMIDVLGVEPPLAVLVTMLSMQGRSVEHAPSQNRRPYRDHHVFNVGELYFQGVVLEDPASDVRAQLAPLLDILWQSAGFDTAPGEPPALDGASRDQ